MNKPLVSVIMPVYNGEKYIKQAVESVYQQGVPLELLVIDDGSTDHTQEVLSVYEGREDFRYLKNEKNMGAAGSRNRGVKEAKGEYIAYLDADDWVEADMLESLYRLAEEDHADVACCLLREENQLEEKDNCTITERTIIHGKNKTESGLALLTVWGPVCKLYR